MTLTEEDRVCIVASYVDVSKTDSTTLMRSVDRCCCFCTLSSILFLDRPESSQNRGLFVADHHHHLVALISPAVISTCTAHSQEWKSQAARVRLNPSVTVTLFDESPLSASDNIVESQLNLNCPGGSTLKTDPLSGHRVRAVSGSLSPSRT